MLSKSQIKRINSLQKKKYRTQLGLFIVEGKKSVLEFMNSNFELVDLFITDKFNIDSNDISNFNYQLITEIELNKISALKNPNQILAVFKIPNKSKIRNVDLILALDDIKDPGNLGTIIRLCDWFGIKQLVCSKETVDCYNPKVVQASMGSITRVEVIYTNLENYLEQANMPIYVSLLQGNNIYKTKLPNQAIIVMGNEANGISDAIISRATNKIHIPHFGDLHQTESLNVAMATSVILSEFRR